VRPGAGGPAAAGHPNVVYVLADDFGYGDVKCLNPRGKIPTPHLDKLASQGMTFTDAHSGRYAWRSTLERGVLCGWSPRLVE
jgi:arylsulfatase A